MRLSLRALVLSSAALVASQQPVVTIQNGTLLGVRSGQLENFRSIPFAQAPVGDLRLRQPQVYDGNFGTLNATNSTPACPQIAFQIVSNPALANLPGNVVQTVLNNPLVAQATSVSEDCLYLNVHRPAGTTADDKLPVVFWIFGGGFTAGWASLYDGPLNNFLNATINLDKPVIIVNAAYRVASLGFLGGRQMQNGSDTNLGFRDQRLALKWVADNIAAFGGDPDRVTLWGESAGSISTAYHYVFEGGDNTYKGKPLFIGGVMNSGAALPTLAVDSPKAQKAFDTISTYSGCNGTADELACLRALPLQEFMQASSQVPNIFSHSTLDLTYVPRPDSSDNFLNGLPSQAFENGAYAKYPMIIGDQEDEGTLFALFATNITTNDQLVDYFTAWFTELPDARDKVAQLVSYYPEDDSNLYGSPYYQGNTTQISAQYKREAALMGDLAFQSERRAMLRLVSGTIPTWSYLATYLRGTKYVGTIHASDVAVDFGEISSLNGNNLTFSTKTKQYYYTSFFYTGDPNGFGNNATFFNWPQWTTAEPTLLHLAAGNNSFLPDTYRSEAFNYLFDNRNDFLT